MNYIFVLIVLLLVNINSLTAESPIKFEPIPCWKAEWSACIKDDDCVIIHGGCYYLLGVNHKFEKVAEELLWKTYGDPRTLNCVRGKDATSDLDSRPYCQNTVCKP